MTGPRFKVDGWQRLLTYHEYLQTASWWRKRTAAINRSHGICEHCTKSAATQVHHTTYERLGAEGPDDLVALCDACHRKQHEAELPPVYSYDVRRQGWPWPWVTIWLAYTISEDFRAKMQAILPPDMWPDMPRTLFAMDIVEEATIGLERLGLWSGSS